MPIVDIQIVESAESDVSPAFTQHIADELGSIFNSGPQQTWVKLSLLPARCYAENCTDESHERGEVGVTVDKEFPAPVFVHVLKWKAGTPEQRQAEAQAISACVARACGRNVENVHVIFEPDAAGRIAFGGELVRR